MSLNTLGSIYCVCVRVCICLRRTSICMGMGQEGGEIHLSVGDGEAMAQRQCAHEVSGVGLGGNKDRISTFKLTHTANSYLKYDWLIIIDVI